MTQTIARRSLLAALSAAAVLMLSPGDSAAQQAEPVQNQKAVQNEPSPADEKNSLALWGSAAVLAVTLGIFWGTITQGTPKLPENKTAPAPTDKPAP